MSTGGLGVTLLQSWVTRQETAAEQVRTCMTQHDLSKARDTIEVEAPEATDFLEDVYSVTIYAACDWPPPAYAAADGYSEIVSRLTSGPGFGEASDSSSLDRIRSTCSRLELSYTYGSQGSSEQLEPYHVSMGDVVSAFTGEPWTGENPYPYPERDEIVVVHNSKIALDGARCLQ